jgi:hypothetical protein
VVVCSPVSAPFLENQHWMDSLHNPYFTWPTAKTIHHYIKPCQATSPFAVILLADKTLLLANVVFTLCKLKNVYTFNTYMLLDGRWLS